MAQTGYPCGRNRLQALSRERRLQGVEAVYHHRGPRALVPVRGHHKG
jgi:hypothetical protein